MKKIILFSLLGCVFFSNVCVAEAMSCDGPGDDCGIYPGGGDVEQKWCLKNANATTFSEKWMAAGSNCNDPQAKTAKCVKQKNKAGEDVMSCEAKICKDDTALWLEKGRSQGRCRTKQQILKMSKCDCKHCDTGERCDPVIFKWNNPGFGETNAFNGEHPCKCKKMSCSELYPKDDQKRACCEAGKEWDTKNNTCDCGKDKEWDKETKKCVNKKVEQPLKPQEDPTPCPVEECKEKCTVTIKKGLKCPDGVNGFSETRKVTVCKDCFEQPMSCPEFQAALDGCNNANCIADKLKMVEQIKELVKALCGTTTPGGNVSAGNNGDGGVMAAERTLRAFFAKADDDDNKSVWKNAEGKFNTARLASDLTAGVVLGTVGGVVSGVVIKKKQVEKGFDALHCAVGGQTVADWGDTFNVGLR